MLVNEVGNVGKMLADSPLSRSRIWTRDVQSIAAGDLLAFVRANKSLELQGEAVRNCDVLVAETIKTIARGQLAAVRFLDFSPPGPVFAATDLVGMLATLPVTRRKALLFGLETGLPLKAIIGLTWRLARHQPLPPLAQQIIRGQPRHMRLQYVFWEYLENGAAAPLFGMEESALEASYGLGYERLQMLYREMVLVDEDAELTAFKESMAL